MYLTRMLLNRRRDGARALMGSPQAMHAAIASAFGDDDPGRTLWRIDQGEHQPVLWLQSPLRPDLTHVAEQAGWPTKDQHWITASLSPLLDRLDSGQRYSYRIVLNPTTASRGRRNAITDPDAAARWWAGKAAHAGIDVEDALSDLESVEPIRFTREGRTVTLSMATFSGTAEVTDPAALREALVCGIGRAKSYGGGLLTLAPA